MSLSLADALKLSCIEQHRRKAEEYLRRSRAEYNPSMAEILFQHAEEQLELAEQLAKEMRS